MGAGRPNEQGLPYYSFYIDYFENKLIEDFLELHQEKGLVFWQRVCCALFKESNYLDWNRRTIKHLKQYGYSDDVMQMYLESLMDVGLVDRGLFDQYKIITSEEIQGMYLKSTVRREKVIFIQEYTLFDFHTRKSILQPIYLYNRVGELLDRFQIREYRKVPFDYDPSHKGHAKHKELNPEGLKKVKAPVTAHVSAPVISPEPQPIPDVAPKPPPEKSQIIKAHTYDNVMNFIGVPYEKRDDTFKSAYFKEEYEAYRAINLKINEHHKYIRKSIHQLTFPEYIEFIEVHMPTASEFNATLDRMKEMVIKKETFIYDALIDYLALVRSSPQVKPPDKPLEPDPVVKVPYFKDEALEKEVLDYWGFNELNHYKNWALMTEFCTVMHHTNQLGWFRTQFNNYVQFTNLTGLEFKHKFTNFLGKKKEMFADGVWNAEIWSDKLASEQKKGARGGSNKSKGGVGAGAVLKAFSDVKMNT